MKHLYLLPLYIYIYDILSKDTKKFISYKYPLIMSAALLISNPSIFISSGIALTIACYLKWEEKYSLKKIISVFITRYSLFAFVCIIYYILYLKNANSDYMQAYWKPYLFPKTFSAWPQYIKDVIIPTARGLLLSYNINLAKFLIFALPIGMYFLWRKNRYIALACILPFFFAGMAAFTLYPPGLGGLVGSRLSCYLEPMLIILIVQGIFPPIRWAVARSSKRVLVLCTYALIGIVCCSNILFAQQGMGYERIYELISKVHSEYTKKDMIIIFTIDEPVYLYRSLYNGEKYPYTVLSTTLLKASEADIDTYLSKMNFYDKNTIYILYSYDLKDDAPKISNWFEKSGYSVEETATNGAILQKIFLRTCQ